MSRFSHGTAFPVKKKKETNKQETKQNKNKQTKADREIIARDESIACYYFTVTCHSIYSAYFMIMLFIEVSHSVHAKYMHVMFTLSKLTLSKFDQVTLTDFDLENLIA